MEASRPPVPLAPPVGDRKDGREGESRQYSGTRSGSLGPLLPSSRSRTFAIPAHGTSRLRPCLTKVRRAGTARPARRMHALSTFPGQHHPVPYGQADILNARVGLDETVKGDDGVSISILGIYHFAAPQNIVADDQPARFE